MTARRIGWRPFPAERQLWFAMRFLEITPIDFNRACADEDSEFDAWRWERLDVIPDIVVPFKQAIYRRVAEAFRVYAQPVSRIVPDARSP